VLWLFNHGTEALTGFSAVLDVSKGLSSDGLVLARIEAWVVREEGVSRLCSLALTSGCCGVVTRLRVAIGVVVLTSVRGVVLRTGVVALVAAISVALTK
jgi:hypothetical protein